jgi:hypothetical protein
MLGDDSSSSATSSSTTSSELLEGIELSCASRIVCRAYCKLSKLRPEEVGFGRLGGKGYIKGGL